MICHNLTAVILTVDPSHLFDTCYAAVENQTLQPAHIEIVRNVMPFSKASQAGLDRVSTEYYLPIDDDMILYPDCFERLYNAITSNKQFGQVIMRLEDPLQGIIEGIRIYRTGAVKKHRFYPLTDEKGCERKMNALLQQSGYILAEIHEIGGDHHPVYQPHEAFWKFRFLAQNAKYYDREGLRRINRYTDRLLKYRESTKDVIALYALAGLFDGLQSDDYYKELTHEGRLEYPAFIKVHEWIESRLQRGDHPASNNVDVSEIVVLP